MTPPTSKRRRCLAFTGAGIAAAMVLMPGTAAADTPQDPSLIDDPFAAIINPLTSLATPFFGPGAPLGGGLPQPALPFAHEATQNPLLGAPDDDDDSTGHETDDPLTPDHAAGQDALMRLGQDGDQALFDVNKYDAAANSDGSSYADVELFGLLGNELVGSHSTSTDPEPKHSNPTEFLCEGTGGALCLSVLYTDTAAEQDGVASGASARGGVLALCLGGSNPAADATNECEDSLVSAGQFEGVGSILRNGDGETTAVSSNNFFNLCLFGDAVGDDPDALPTLGEDVGSDDPGYCDGFGTRIMPASSGSSATESGAETVRDSEFLVFDGPGTELLNESMGFAIPPDCGDPSLLCMFLNQGESFLITDGAASAQEATHLDLLKDTPLAILAEGYKADTLARLDPGSDGECDPNGNDPDCDNGEETECADGQDNDGDGLVDLDDPDCSGPDDDSEGGDAECNDGVDNDGDQKIDFGNDPGCDSASDDSEKDAGLASTGADVAPLLAGAFALIGFGALTVAATRGRGSREGRHSA